MNNLIHKTVINRKSLLILFGIVFVFGFSYFSLNFNVKHASATTASSTSPCVSATAPTQWKHVVVLMFENKKYSSVIGSSSAPYISNLASQCGSYSNWYDANTKVNGTIDGTYNSKPNYATLTSGVPPTVHGLIDDTYTTTTGVDNIYNELKIAGKVGKDYYSAAATSTPCAGSNFSGAYHDAIRYYSDLGTSYCNSHDSPLSSFMTDVNAGTLPSFSMILPTNDENMHNNTIASGDTWAQNFLNPLLDSAQYKSGDTAIFFLWDEDTPIPNVLIAPSVVSGSKVTAPTGNPISHYSALRTWEEMLGLPLIGDTSQAPSLLSYYNGGAPPPPPPQDNPPAVNLTSPANGSTLTTSPATISANATDDIGISKVEFYDGNTLLNTDSAAPYSYSWDVSQLSGSHTITAKAYDTGGHVTTSTAVTVTVSISVSCGAAPSTSLGTGTIVINTPATGTYHVWSRIMAPDTTNNSYYVQIDSNCPVNVGDSTSITPNSWVWVDYQNGTTTSKIVTPSLAAGSHTVTMIGRESGVKVDRVLLLSNTCVPTGTGENCADTTAPTVSVTQPTNSQSVSGNVAIAATASDNSGGSGIAKVEFLVDNNVLSTTTTSPYQYSWDSTSVADGSHNIQARATDVAGNVTTSNAINVSVKNADTTPPSSPANLTLITDNYNKVSFKWDASTDNVGVTSYEVQRNGSTIATTNSSTYTYADANVTENTSYSYSIIAVDAAGNRSSPSSALVVVTPQAPDTTAPSAPTNLTGRATSATSSSLQWSGSTDNVAVTQYYVKRNGVVVGTTAANTTSYNDSGLSPLSSYSYSVVATDAAGNISNDSNTLGINTPALPDTQAPTAPSNLSYIVNGTQVNLVWTPSTDNVGVAGYVVFRGSSQLATSTTPDFGDATVTAGQTYTYHVTAYDAAGNASGASNQVSVTIPIPPPPSDKTLTFSPTDDAWLKQDAPKTNFGSAEVWKSDISPVENGIIKVKVSGIKRRVVTSAKLTLFNTNASTNGGSFHAVNSNNWDEQTVTWNNAPKTGREILQMGAVQFGNYYNIDLSNYITSDGTYTIRVTNSIANGAGYASKENSTTSKRPLLTVTVQ